MTERKKIAIIGASTGQKILYRKAREMGLEVIGFACDRGVLEDGMYDAFYEISVTDTDSIVNVCRAIGVDGVVTNASEFLIPLSSEIAGKLNLPCTQSDTIRRIQDKEYVRQKTGSIEGLSQPRYYLHPNQSIEIFPCIVKPTKGAAKKGVSFCMDGRDFEEALRYAGDGHSHILVEEYIPGREFSVESLSFRGKHQVIQITDKENSGPPHFVELGHHQPSTVDDAVKARIMECIGKILDSVGFTDGASHVEMKYDPDTDRLFLIEINCRGGGDHISDTLVGLSTDCDYSKEIIDIALGEYEFRETHHKAYSGICYLSKQNEGILKYFSTPSPEWIVYSERSNDELSESTSNHDRDGFFIYKSSKPIKP